MDSLQLQRRIQ